MDGVAGFGARSRNVLHLLPHRRSLRAGPACPARRAGDTKPASAELRLLDNIQKRVRLWPEVEPFYDDKIGAGKSVESRGTEAVLNALILVSQESHNPELSSDAREAVHNMWAVQQTTGDLAGSWPWLQFELEPWEGRDSRYYGAALAAVAVSRAPRSHHFSAESQRNLTLLRDYLNRNYATQSPLNHAVVLWALRGWPDLLTAEHHRSIVDELAAKQESDGGWSLASLARSPNDWSVSSLARLWFRSDRGGLPTGSDGYATGLVVFALEQAAPSLDAAAVKRGRTWLVRNQDAASGRWPSYSLNGSRNHAAGVGLFMNDAATAYAVLALESTNP